MFKKIENLRSMMHNAIDTKDDKESLKFSKDLDTEIVNYYKNADKLAMENLKSISDLELAVMQEIWTNNNSIRKVELIYILKRKQRWEDLVLLNTIDKLEEKSFIKGYYDDNDEKFYKAIVLRNIYVKMVTKDFFSKVHRNSIKSLISSVNATSEIKEEELKEILESIYGE